MSGADADGAEYGDERLEAACARALAIGNPTLRSVEAILKNGLEKVALAEEVESKPVLHENIRGGDYFDREEATSRDEEEGIEARYLEEERQSIIHERGAESSVSDTHPRRVDDARRGYVSQAAAAIAAADLDGDGRIDLVVAHVGEQVSTVLLNAGGGAFRPAGTVPSSGKLRIADMDGDRIPDLLVLGDTLVLYRGKGDGTFEATRHYPFGGSEVAVGDVDGDGRPDIVLPAGNRSPFVSELPHASR